MILAIVLEHQRNKLVLILQKQIQNFQEFTYSGDEIYLYVNKIEIWKVNALYNISWYEFRLGHVSKNFTQNRMKELSLNGTLYDFSVDHSAVEKEDVRNPIQDRGG